MRRLLMFSLVLICALAVNGAAQTTFTITGTPELGKTMNFELCAPVGHFACIMFSEGNVPTPLNGYNIPEAPISLPTLERHDTTIVTPNDCLSVDITVPCQSYLVGRTIYVWAFSIDLINDPNFVHSMQMETLTISDPGDTGRVDVKLYEDTNGNGTCDNADTFFPGVGVDLLCAGPDGLFGTADDATQSALTDATGLAQFTNVVTGQCMIDIDMTMLPASYSLMSGFTNFNVPSCERYTLFGEMATQLPGGEGCTPGYWKQPQHFLNWTAPYTPSTLFSDVFEDAFPGLTLLDVLELGEGDLNALGRHTVAALLNSVSNNVSYAYSEAEVINMFNAVMPGTPRDIEDLKDTFEVENELGCGL